MEPLAGARLKTRLSDLSLNGCYVDTLHPPAGRSTNSPEGRQEQDRFGSVRHCHLQ